MTKVAAVENSEFSASATVRIAKTTPSAIVPASRAYSIKSWPSASCKNRTKFFMCGFAGEVRPDPVTGIGHAPPAAERTELLHPCVTNRRSPTTRSW